MYEKLGHTQSFIIPKIIHFIWAGGYTSMPPSSLEVAAKWAMENPDFKIHIWIDTKTSGTELEKMVAYYKTNFLTAYNKVAKEQNKPAIQSIDNILQVSLDTSMHYQITIQP